MGEPIANIDAIVAAPAKVFRSTGPEFGEVSWEAPPSFRTWLECVGRFSLTWHSPLGEMNYQIAILGAGRSMSDVGELVYAGHGAVSDVKLSLAHLVPFASAGDEEAAFCFDTAAPGPEYPVLYHHQDEGRFRVAATGEWHRGSPEEPEFENFTAWLDWLVYSFTNALDPCEQGLGSPNFAPGR